MFLSPGGNSPGDFYFGITPIVDDYTDYYFPAGCIPTANIVPVN